MNYILQSVSDYYQKPVKSVPLPIVYALAECYDDQELLNGYPEDYIQEQVAQLHGDFRMLNDFKTIQCNYF